MEKNIFKAFIEKITGKQMTVFNKYKTLKFEKKIAFFAL